MQFCDCIYSAGKPLDQCLDAYEQAKEEAHNGGIK
jgi:hypothetical protein